MLHEDYWETWIVWFEQNTPALNELREIHSFLEGSLVYDFEQELDQRVEEATAEITYELTEKVNSRASIRLKAIHDLKPDEAELKVIIAGINGENPWGAIEREILHQRWSRNRPSNGKDT